MKRMIRLCMVFALLCVAGCLSGKSQAQAADTYKIRVNKQCCVVNVYKYDEESAKYKIHKAFICSPGYATPVGTHHLGEKMRWHTLDGPTYGQYCSRITGSILFHSVWYYQPEKDTQSYVQYNRLGTLASHGCVRLTVADAKWIYDNVPSGTEVKVYNSSNPGPLGKPAAIKVNGSQGWDPTDPDPENPYLKKNPKISGVKRIVYIDYGDKYDEEIARLQVIGIDDYEGIYTVTGEPEGYDLVAMDSDDYSGFVYAMIPEDQDGNTKITYCAIVFCNYFLDLDVHEYMPDKYLLPGFDATDDNPYKKEIMGT